MFKSKKNKTGPASWFKYQFPEGITSIFGNKSYNDKCSRSSTARIREHNGI